MPCLPRAAALNQVEGHDLVHVPLDAADSARAPPELWPHLRSAGPREHGRSLDPSLVDRMPLGLLSQQRRRCRILGPSHPPGGG